MATVGLVDVPRVSLDDGSMPTEEQRKIAGLAVRNRRIRKGLTPPGLGRAADVDAKTVRSLESGERWPQEVSRGKIEEALEWEIGTIERIAHGEEPSGLESESAGLLDAKERHPAVGLQAIERDRRGYDSDDLWQRIEDSVDLVASLAMRGADPGLCRGLLDLLEQAAVELIRLTASVPPHSYTTKMRTIPLMVKGLSGDHEEEEARHAQASEDQEGSHPDVQGTRDRTPIDLAHARRVKDDPAAFGDQPRRGELDQGKLQPPPPAHKSAAYEPRDGSEGITEAQRARERGEESQDDA